MKQFENIIGFVHHAQQLILGYCCKLLTLEEQIKIHQIMSKRLLQYGIIFRTIYFSENPPYRNFVPCKNTVRNSTVQIFLFFFCTVIPVPYLSVPHFFIQLTSRTIQQETCGIATSKSRIIVLRPSILAVAVEQSFAFTVHRLQNIIGFPLYQ